MLRQDIYASFCPATLTFTLNTQTQLSAAASLEQDLNNKHNVCDIEQFTSGFLLLYDLYIDKHGIINGTYGSHFDVTAKYALLTP